MAIFLRKTCFFGIQKRSLLGGNPFPCVTVPSNMFVHKRPSSNIVCFWPSKQKLLGRKQHTKCVPTFAKMALQFTDFGLVGGSKKRGDVLLGRLCRGRYRTVYLGVKSSLPNWKFSRPVAHRLVGGGESVLFIWSEHTLYLTGKLWRPPESMGGKSGPSVHFIWYSPSKNEVCRAPQQTVCVGWKGIWREQKGKAASSLFSGARLFSVLFSWVTPFSSTQTDLFFEVPVVMHPPWQGIFFTKGNVKTCRFAFLVVQHRALSSNFGTITKPVICPPPCWGWLPLSQGRKGHLGKKIYLNTSSFQIRDQLSLTGTPIYWREG